MGAPNASEAGAGRLVGAALACYPARWRRRHGEEAAELAALLIRDGTPAASIAWSYLIGAAREWLAPRPRRSPGTVAAALLAATCLLGFSAALLAETVPAKAASTTQSPSSPAPPRIPTIKPASTPHKVAPCGPVPPRHVTGAVDHSQPSVQGTAHARSC